jgi:hypothetical protein
MKYFATIATFFCFVAVPASALAGCGHYSSSSSSQPADVKFENKTRGKVYVIWYTFNGGTKKYMTLAAGQSYVQATFTEHVWEVTDANGKCISTLVVKHSQTFNIH